MKFRSWVCNCRTMSSFDIDRQFLNRCKCCSRFAIASSTLFFFLFIFALLNFIRSFVLVFFSGVCFVLPLQLFVFANWKFQRQQMIARAARRCRSTHTCVWWKARHFYFIFSFLVAFFRWWTWNEPKLLLALVHSFEFSENILLLLSFFSSCLILELWLFLTYHSWHWIWRTIACTLTHWCNFFTSKFTCFHMCTQHSCQ